MSDCVCNCVCCVWQYVAKATGTYGGNGGALGQPGGNSTGNGGAAGAHVVGNSFVTWTVPGTRLGPATG